MKKYFFAFIALLVFFAFTLDAWAQTTTTTTRSTTSTTSTSSTSTSTSTMPDDFVTTTNAACAETVGGDGSQVDCTIATPSDIQSGCWKITLVDGDATSLEINFYTSFASTGSSWQIMAPPGPLDSKPATLKWVSAGASISTTACFDSLPRYTARVRAKGVASGGTPTDTLVLDFIPKYK